MIEAEKIQLSLKGKAVLKGLSFRIEAGRVTAFIGKSGAGKTSLLKCLGGLVEYEGALRIAGKDLQALTKRERIASIGFVFQQHHLFPHMTVLKNVSH
ncbi:MAG: ATP-binding cassette domain-containing protein, partial [Verrucomicrobia bacterium]|nr:ATP-binding cassette domain-containing protein [Verrucomicrobiota bacterium]